MSKRMITITLLIMLSIGIVSLYTTFAYDEEAVKLDESLADYNLIYSIKENSNRQITIGAKEEKYIDITVKNPHVAPIKYGIYYFLVSPDNLPDNVEIKLADDSIDKLEDTIKPNKTRSISIRITNNSDYAIELIVGALAGYENGKIEELIKDGEVLIK